ncbi:MAG: phosphoribosyltransferase family protein [Patescibacteria group bacterium]
MLKRLKEIICTFLDIILPPRTDFDIVRKLTAKDIFELPRNPHVENADWIHPLFYYKNPKVKAIIWELKYRENTLPLDHIGTLLYEEIVALVSDIVIFDSDAEFLLIPIPISVLRRTERGYNQSEYIAKAVFNCDTAHTLLYAPQWFQKTVDTPKQSRSQSREERMHNLTGCFEADPRVAGKYIILIDDVVTTGSTLSEARHTLLSAGAKDVYAFTIAH